MDAKGAIDLGGLVSFSGVLTFKNAAALREIAAALPLDRLMIETDCPYMAPVPYRGQRCEPAYVAEVAKTLAFVKNVEPDYAAADTTDKAKNFYGLNRDDENSIPDLHESSFARPARGLRLQPNRRSCGNGRFWPRQDGRS